MWKEEIKYDVWIEREIFNDFLTSGLTGQNSQKSESISHIFKKKNSSSSHTDTVHKIPNSNLLSVKNCL